MRCGDALARLIAILLVPLLLGSGCAYRIGSGLVAGALDEAGGEGRSVGVEEVGDRVLERALLVELGHQLGAGLSSGATEITPDQQAQLERVIDGLLATAARRTGKGLRGEVSPELRDMVRRSIVETLAEGLRGELGDSLEETIDRVVTQALVSLRYQVESHEMRAAVSDLLRDSIYFAVHEEQGHTPSVGKTLEWTLTHNVLDPLDDTVAKLTGTVASQVEEAGKQAENQLKAIVSFLTLAVLVMSLVLYFRGRQLRKAQETQLKAEAGVKGIDAALELLDEHTRKQVVERLGQVTPAPQPRKNKGGPS